MNSNTHRAMRICRPLLLLTAASVAQVRGTLAQEISTAPAGELRAVRAFWTSLDSIWKERDAPAFRELFTEDASFAFVDRGVTLEPRTMIDRHFIDQFARQSPDLIHTSSVRAARVVAPGVLTADVGIEVRRVGTDGAGPSLLRRFDVLAVMRRTDDRWRIELLRAYLLPVASP
jgi:uncharacterized protein (TIGR02246 family)